MARATSLGARLGHIVGTVTNVVLLLVALFVAAYYYTNWPSTRSAAQALGGGSAPPYKAGDRFDAPDVLPKGGARTLVVALSSACRYCNDSMPFYRELQERKPPSSRLLAISREPSTESFSNHLRTHGFAPDSAVAGVVLPHVRMTPTMILLDASGVVERVWEGQLNAAGQKEVMAEWVRSAER